MYSQNIFFTVHISKQINSLKAFIFSMLIVDIKIYARTVKLTIACDIFLFDRTKVEIIN